MASSRFAERLEAAQQQALHTCMEQAKALVETMLGPNGSAFGDVTLSPADRIARFEDMAARGVIDILETISPPTYQMLISDYVKDVSASPLIRSA